MVGVKLKDKDPAANKPVGPRVPPGTYQVRLEIGEIRMMQPFDILKDPRVPATPVVFSSDSKPTQAAYEVYAQLAADVDVQLARLQEVKESEVAAFNDMVSQTGISALVA